MAKPAQPMMKYSPTLTPHRERSTQMVPDATMEGASIAKKIGKGNMSCMTVSVSLGRRGLEREKERERERDLLLPSFAEVVQWDIDDVCRWLEELGLGDHCAAFQERTIIGTKLLGLRKSDLQVGF